MASVAVSALAAYSGLFLAAFLAATLVPAQSEAVLASLLAIGHYSPTLLILVAGTGNVLGSVVNWLLGRGIERYREARWFPSVQKAWSVPATGIAATAGGACWRAGCPSSAIP